MFTSSHLSAAEFEASFENKTLPQELFDHPGHLRLSYIHITKYGLEQAISNVSEQIQAYAAHHGDTKKFHVTLTHAAVRTMDHFIKKEGALTFEELLTKYPRLVTNFKDLINQHYSWCVLTSIDSKEKYLEPDLLAF